MGVLVPDESNKCINQVGKEMECSRSNIPVIHW